MRKPKVSIFISVDRDAWNLYKLLFDPDKDDNIEMGELPDFDHSFQLYLDNNLKWGKKRLAKKLLAIDRETAINLIKIGYGIGRIRNK